MSLTEKLQVERGCGARDSSQPIDQARISRRFLTSYSKYVDVVE